MSMWQDIVWSLPNWGKQQWIQLESLLNTKSDFQLLVIQYPLEQDLKHAYWYEISFIQRASFHEGLFSLFLGWEAFFEESLRQWVWNWSPKEDGRPVNIRDFDTLQKMSDYTNHSYQPKLVRTTHGDLLRIGEDTIVFPEYSYNIDPLDEVKDMESTDGSIYGGVFILPPDYRARLYPNQVQYLQKVR